MDEFDLWCELQTKCDVLRRLRSFAGFENMLARRKWMNAYLDLNLSAEKIRSTGHRREVEETDALRFPLSFLYVNS